MFGRRRLYFLLLVLFVCSLITFYLACNYEEPNESMYEELEGQIILVKLKEITDAEMKWYINEKLIFFLETSRRIKKGFIIDPRPRQLCAVESAARTNPDSIVFLLYLSPEDLEDETLYLNKTDRLNGQILNYRNIKLRKISLSRYMTGTLLEEWYFNGSLSTSHFPTEHSSDILRYVTLWKYGGTYLDLDFVILKNLNNIGSDYVVAESQWYTSNAVLNFRDSGIGHKFAEDCLKEVRDNYHGSEYSYNGPVLIKRIMERYCNTSLISEMNKTRCNGINLYQPSLFYAVNWDTTDAFFNPQNLSFVLNLIESSYGVHLWNQYTGDKIAYTSIKNVPYGVLAKNHCPRIYANVGPAF